MHPSTTRSTRELLERSGYFVEGAIVMGSTDAAVRSYGYGYAEGYGIGGAADLVVRSADDSSSRGRAGTMEPIERSAEPERN